MTHKLIGATLAVICVTVAPTFGTAQILNKGEPARPVRDVPRLINKPDTMAAPSPEAGLTLPSTLFANPLSSVPLNVTGPFNGSTSEGMGATLKALSR